MPVNPFAVQSGLPPQPKPLFFQKVPKTDALADALIQGAYASQPQSPFEAIGKLAQLYAGTRQKDKYLDAQEAKARAPIDSLRAALASGKDPLEAMLSSEDPELFLAGLKQKMAAPEYDFTNVDGTLVRTDATGNATPVFGGGAAGGDAPPFRGTSMDAQSWNIILRGDPASPEYAAAYNQLFQTPKMVQGVDSEGRQIVTPIMPTVPQGVQPPGGVSATGGPAAASTTTVGAGTASAAPQPGAPIVTGQRPPTESQIKGETLLASAAPDYALAIEKFDAMNDLVSQAADPAGALGRFAQSPDYQIAKDAVSNIVQSYIYAVSGAQAPEQEVARNAALVMPQIGDGPERIAYKKRRLGQMMQAIYERAGQDAPPDMIQSSLPATDPEIEKLLEIYGGQ